MVVYYAFYVFDVKAFAYRERFRSLTGTRHSWSEANRILVVDGRYLKELSNAFCPISQALLRRRTRNFVLELIYVSIFRC